MPKISVIIPNYNHALYLPQRIDSVLNQTYRDFEVIILDDCSTDNSRSVIESYRANNRISHIVYNELNGGSVFKQWDKGIQLAAGEYVWIAESDDWCENNLLETLLEGFEENQGCVLAYCQSYCINEDGSIRFQSNHRRLKECINGKKFISEYMLPKNPVFNAGMALWKRKAYASISKEYLNYTLSGDYLFWIELCMAGDVFISGKLLNYLRMHGKNVGVRSFKEGLNFLEMIPLLKSLLQRNIINKFDFKRTLKKEYVAFKLSEKKLPGHNVQHIKKLFLSNTNSTLGFQFYFLAKQLRFSLKKMLRV